MNSILPASLLLGAGFLIGLVGSQNAARGQARGGARPPMNRPAPQARPATPAARPAPPISAPTPSRPQARPMPAPAPAAPRPSIGQRPNVGGPSTLPASRPVAPRPVAPSRPPVNLPQTPNRPTTLPGGFGPTTRPVAPVNPPIAGRPPINSNIRPGVQPSLPNMPATRPGLQPPTTLPATRPTLPPIGQRPAIPTPPNRPNIDWANRPTTLPARPDTGGIARPTPPIAWPNRPSQPVTRPNFPEGGGTRPNIPNRPGFNPDGSLNTIVNRPNSNNTVNINNIHQNNNYFNNQNFYNFNGYRPGVGNSIYGWHNAWYGNYNTWHTAVHPWYHGCWNGNIFNNWGVGPVGWGLTMWGLNSLRYNFGYTAYVNPFVVQAPVAVPVPVPVYENYSQPLVNVVQAVPESGQEPPRMPETASQAFNAAQAAFKDSDYATALVKTEQALKDFPDDPVLHEFRALVCFAQGKYKQASTILHALLASGPGWDWTTMSSLYASTKTYEGQLAALERATGERPEDPALQFLLAYHFMTIGNAEGAKAALAQAKKLLPNDPVVAQLAGAGGVESARAEAKPPPAAADVKLDIVGAWSAPRGDGGTIGLALTKDGAFTWTVTDKAGKKDSFDGTFTLESDLLILERKSGGALMGKTTPLAADKFLFRVLGSDDTDPGLTFSR
jgi:tetratricopeptide (TPR) repeat protein